MRHEALNESGETTYFIKYKYVNVHHCQQQQQQGVASSIRSQIEKKENHPTTLPPETLKLSDVCVFFVRC